MVGHMMCIWARVADDLLRHSTPIIHGDRRWLYHTKHIQGQAIEAWRHSFSHKLGGNVLSPVIAISPDRTMVLSFDVLSVSPVTHTHPKRTREHRQWRHSGIIQYQLIGNHQRFCCLRCFPTSLDNTMVGHMMCIWARVADDLLRHSTPIIHGDRRWLYGGTKIT